MSNGSIKVTPEDLDQLGKTCSQASEQLHQVLNTLVNQVATTASSWQSEASQRFMEDWETHKTNIKNVQEAVTSLGDAANKMAENYRQADASYQGG